MPELVMPRLSDSMEEGTILSWLKQVGEEVAVGEELVEIETDKANMAYESDVAGTLTEIIAQEGATLEIGKPIAVVGDPSEGSNGTAAGPDEGEAPSAGPVADASPTVLGASGTSAPRGAPASAPPAEGATSADEATTAGAAPSEGQAASEAAPSNGSGAGRVKASPIARRLAREKNIDLTSIQGSGPGGRVVKADVSAAGDGPAAGTPGPSPSSPETAKCEVTVEELSKLQQTVARRMAESKATAPHFYLTAEIEMSKAVAARQAIKAQSPEGEIVPSFNDMVIKACAIALGEFPKANGAYRDGHFELYSRVNVGLAVAAPGALATGIRIAVVVRARIRKCSYCYAGHAGC